MSDNKKVIAFSSADSYIGETLSRYMAIHGLHDFQKIRGLIKKESFADELKKVGIEPHVIDYEKPETLEKALQGVHCLVFVIGDDEKRVHEAEKLIDAIKKTKVCGVVLISCAATEHGEGKRLCEYKEVEEKVAKIEHHKILRITWPYQLFFLWTRMIQNEGKLRLAVTKDSKFTPIDIRDVGKAVHKILVKKEDEPDTSHHKFVLTGPETIKAEQVVDKLNSTVQANVGFEETTQEKLKQYLESLKKGQNEAHEPEDFVPHHSQITDVCIEVLLEAQDLIKKGKHIDKTDDLKGIIGKEGEKLEVFFKDHQQYFKPSK